MGKTVWSAALLFKSFILKEYLTTLIDWLVKVDGTYVLRLSHTIRLVIGLSFWRKLQPKFLLM